MPALDPGIISSCGELEIIRRRHAAFPAERLLLRSKSNFNELFAHNGVRGDHILSGQKWNAQGDRFSDRRKSCHRRSHLPDQSKLEIAIDHRDGLQILAIVTRLSRTGFILPDKEDLLLGRAIRLHSAERPTRRIDADLAWLEKKCPFPFCDVC